MKLSKMKNISYIGTNFKEWFGDPEIKPKKVKLYTKELPRNMTDKEILDELKPTGIALNELMGQLNVIDKSKWYLAYIRDKKNVLRAVLVRWGGGGWNVHANSVKGPGRWSAVSRVFSRQFSEPLSPSDTLTLGHSFACPHCNNLIHFSK